MNRVAATHPLTTNTLIYPRTPFFNAPGFICCYREGCLLWNDVFRLRAFLAIGDGELHFLTIGEGFETIALNSAEVYKDIRPIFLCYEAIAFCLVKPLHGTRYC